MSRRDQLLAQAKDLIDELVEHEGSEGFSLDTHDRIKAWYEASEGFEAVNLPCEDCDTSGRCTYVCLNPYESFTPWVNRNGK